MIIRDDDLDAVFCPFTPPPLCIEEGERYELSYVQKRVRSEIDLYSYELKAKNGHCTFKANFEGNKLHFIYVQQGTLTLSKDNISVSKQICILLDEQPVHFDICEETSFIVIECVSTANSVLEYLQYFERPTRLQKVIDAPSELFEHLNEIGIYHESKRRSAIYLEAKAIEVLAFLFSTPEVFKESTVRRYKPSPNDRKAIEDTAAYLEENLGEDHSIEKISRHVGINEFKLKNGFKVVFGTTVFGFLREQRMIEAKSLLEKQELTVIEIANVLGYSNPSHFSRAFKAMHNILPKAYQISLQT
jgi:AraC-like DNA-binding protein